MALTISRIDRVPITYAINVRDANGDPAVLATIDFALVTPRTGVTPTTTWVTVNLTAITPAPTAADDPTHEATVVYVGPDATAQANDLVVPLGGADLHQKRTDGGYVDAEPVTGERISVR